VQLYLDDLLPQLLVFLCLLQFSSHRSIGHLLEPIACKQSVLLLNFHCTLLLLMNLYVIIAIYPIESEIALNDFVTYLLVEDVLVLPNLKVLGLIRGEITGLPHTHQQFLRVRVHLLVQSFLERPKLRHFPYHYVQKQQLLILSDRLQRQFIMAHPQ
jgi:hypothetical protein